jgi:hypothetical protein
MSTAPNPESVANEKAEHARISALTLLELLRSTQKVPLEP